MLRDRLVVGIRDAAMSQKLQMDAELTLEKAKKAIRQKEAVYEQQRELLGDGSAKDPIVVDEVRHTVAEVKRQRAVLATGHNPKGEEPEEANHV